MNFIVRLFACFSVITLACGSFLSGAKANQGVEDLGNQIDAYFQRLVREQDFSGAVLVAQEGQIVLEAGYGSAYDATGEPVTADTLFMVGSLTKQFTATAVLRLVTDGKLDLHDPITVYLPDVPPDKSTITIHHLLTHSAGFRHDHSPGDLVPMTRAEALEAILQSELEFEPGSDYAYSNAGYTLLAILVELVTGQSYIEFLEKDFFEPLGMAHTGYFNDPALKGYPVAHSYWNDEETGKPVDFPGPYWGLIGNGGVMSTVGDMYLWWQALASHQILDRAHTGMLFTRHIAENGDSYYGYGWSLADTQLGPIITHNGGGLGGSADLAVYPERDLVIVILSNRIVWKTLFGAIPYEIRIPATEAREQLARNIASGDFLKTPTPTFLLGPILVLLLSLILLLSAGFLWLKRRRKTDSR